MAVRISIFPALVALAAGASALAPDTARAGDSYDTCRSFVDTLPAVIDQQGHWCLHKDLATAISSGAAITVLANNVTLDCKGFKIGGLAAGAGSMAHGVKAEDRHNLTVRNCNIRGFRAGVYTTEGSGVVVEDSRLDNNYMAGAYLLTGQSVVRRNLVNDTGGAPGGAISIGIFAAGDVLDNTVDGVFAGADVAQPHGIWAGGHGSEVKGNRVRGLVLDLDDIGHGIRASGSGARIVDNHVSAVEDNKGYGIRGDGALTACSNNVVVTFAHQYESCEAGLDNLQLP